MTASDVGGPFGPAADVLFGLAPIAFLLVATLKRNPIPSTISLPLAAGLMALVRLMYYGSDVVNTAAAIVQGLHSALTPLAIIAGAIFLFEGMECTNSLPWIMRQMKIITAGHPVAEAMVIGWAFAYVVEGASGFGTPAALAAPMLASIGHDPVASVVFVLISNTFATVFGAVGTPMWFGFASLGLSSSELQEVGFRASICVAVSAMILMPLALTTLLPWTIVRENILFVLLSTFSCVGPAVGLSVVSTEFPTILGGLCGLVVTSCLVRSKVGLHAPRLPLTDKGGNHHTDAPSSSVDAHGPEFPLDPACKAQCERSPFLSPATQPQGDPILSAIELGPRSMPPPQITVAETLCRTFPIWGTIVLLIVTRLEPLGVKELLQSRNPHFSIDFGTYGKFSLSASLVFSLQNILTDPNTHWSFELLYVPFILPFVAVTAASLFMYRSELTKSPRELVKTVASRIHQPAKALFGALALVSLMRNGGDASPAALIGTTLSDALGEAWIAVAALAGVLGSFFSGSTTVSNLTFGGVQLVAADTIGVSATSILALQCCGATMGNAVCINNIVAASAVIGVTGRASEGTFIKRTAPFVFGFWLIATGVSLALFIRF